MATELEIHPIQVKILRFLLFKPEARFGELNTEKLTTDHFTFHLKKLVEAGILEKGTTNGKYHLTAKGKEFANRFDTEKKVLEKQAKLGALVVAIKRQYNITKYLTQQRLKQPFYGYRGFITGKIRWGEKVLQTAGRELREEANLTAKLEFVGIEHKMDYSPINEILEDKFFYVIKATQTEGNLIENFEGGKNSWLTEKEIVSDPKVFEDVPKILKRIKQNKFFFMEDKYQYSEKQY